MVTGHYRQCTLSPLLHVDISSKHVGVELANLRVKAVTQEETLSQLREQQSRYKPPNTGYHMVQENTDTVQLYKEKCNSLEGIMLINFIIHKIQWNCGTSK